MQVFKMALSWDAPEVKSGVQTLLNSEILILELALFSTVEQPKSMVQSPSPLGYMYGSEPDPNPEPWLGPPTLGKKI